MTPNPCPLTSLPKVSTSHRADRVVLHNISWEQFERLLEDLGDRRSACIAYDNGTLEIMTPLPEHEYFHNNISTIFKRGDWRRGEGHC